MCEYGRRTPNTDRDNLKKVKFCPPLPRSGARRGHLREAYFHRFVPKYPLTVRRYTPKLHIYHIVACAEVWVPNPECKPHFCGKSENLTFLPISEALTGDLTQSLCTVSPVILAVTS